MLGNSFGMAFFLKSATRTANPFALKYISSLLWLGSILTFPRFITDTVRQVS